MRGVLHACLPCLGSGGLGKDLAKPAEDVATHNLPKLQERQGETQGNSKKSHPPKQKKQLSLSKYTFPRVKEDSP